MHGVSPSSSMLLEWQTMLMWTGYLHTHTHTQTTRWSGFPWQTLGLDDLVVPWSWLSEQVRSLSFVWLQPVLWCHCNDMQWVFCASRPVARQLLDVCFALESLLSQQSQNCCHVRATHTYIFERKIHKNIKMTSSLKKRPDWISYNFHPQQDPSSHSGKLTRLDWPRIWPYPQKGWVLMLI